MSGERIPWAEQLNEEEQAPSLQFCSCHKYPGAAVLMGSQIFYFPPPINCVMQTKRNVILVGKKSFNYWLDLD